MNIDNNFGGMPTPENNEKSLIQKTSKIEMYNTYITTYRHESTNFCCRCLLALLY